ncbi:MAG: tetratricopeptide repeat protein [Myxococcales bacterium]|nr:tetratricopeptide repeat protein [Myxococcales bacterium]
MDEMHREIKVLRGVVEDHTEAIDKTLDASSQIARAMEVLAQRQKSRGRAQQLNSFVAYMLFTVLLGGAFYVLYLSRSAAITQARDEALESAKEARARARDLQDSQVERKRSARAAAEYYRLIREGRSGDVIAGYDALEELELSETEREVFVDGLKNARAEMVESGFLAGVEAFRRNDFEAATAELRRGLAYSDEGERMAEMRYYLGISLSSQGSQPEAIAELEKAIEGRVEQAGIYDARFHLANTLVKAGDMPEARQAFTKFATKHPNHRFAQMARRKAVQILRAARRSQRMARESPRTALAPPSIP